MLTMSHQPPLGPSSLRVSTNTHTVPSPALGEVLIRVSYASVIATELYWPIYQDKHSGEYCGSCIPCHDFSGIVEQCPGNEIAVGTSVFAFTTTYDYSKGWRKYQGAAAQFSLADVDSVLPIPKTLSLEEAASVPLSALTCWQVFRNEVEIKSGMIILINGAAGPTGLWAVQVSKFLGAHVTGTASAAQGIDMLNKLTHRPDKIINYKEEDITCGGQRFDIVFDAVGGDAAAKQISKVIKPNGVVLSICDPTIADKIKVNGVRAKFYTVRMNRTNLQDISRLIDEGQFHAMVDSVWDLADGIEAYKYAGQGHSHGKVLLRCKSEE